MGKRSRRKTGSPTATTSIDTTSLPRGNSSPGTGEKQETKDMPVFGSFASLPPDAWEGGPRVDLEAFLGSEHMQRYAFWGVIRQWLFLVLTTAGLSALLYYWWTYWLPRADVVAAQLAYAAIFQGTGALVGLAALAITFLWSQSASSKASLQELAPKYAEIAFTPVTRNDQNGERQLPRIMILLD
jgi:hypothetical protein